MGRKLNLNIAQAENILGAIQALGQKDKTTRRFNFMLNFNHDELESFLKTAYKSLHDRPEKVKEYDNKLRDLKIKHSALPQHQYPQGADIPWQHIQNTDKFKEEALDLKKEYKESLKEWDELNEENQNAKEEIEQEIDFYICPSDQAPQLEPQLEYWIGFMLDYTEEFGEDIPERKRITSMKNPSEIRKEVEEENAAKSEEAQPSEEKATADEAAE